MNRVFVKFLISFIILNFFLSFCYAQPAIDYTQSPLEITEEDTDPSTFPYKLKFPNGTVTNNGDSTASIGGPISLLGSSIDDTEFTPEDFGDWTCTGLEDGCTVDNDAINDLDIDWGTGANQVSLDDIPDGASYERVVASELSSGIYKDATNAIKGIASFNSTNFSVSSGAVNTIQNINTTATPTFEDLYLTDLLQFDTSGVGYDAYIKSSGNTTNHGTLYIQSISPSSQVLDVEITHGDLKVGRASNVDGVIAHNFASNNNLLNLKTFNSLGQVGVISFSYYGIGVGVDINWDANDGDEFITTTDNYGNLGSSTKRFKNLFLAGTATLDGQVIIDNTATETLLIRKNADAGDLMAWDTTNLEIANSGEIYSATAGSNVALGQINITTGINSGTTVQLNQGTDEILRAYVFQAGAGAYTYNIDLMETTAKEGQSFIISINMPASTNPTVVIRDDNSGSPVARVTIAGTGSAFSVGCWMFYTGSAWNKFWATTNDY